MAKKDVSEHARALSKLGAQKGGRARTGKMTSEQRHQLAKKAAAARWGKSSASIPRSTSVGEITVGKLGVEAVVVETDVRLITERGIAAALGKKNGGRRGIVKFGVHLKSLLRANQLKPFVSPELERALTDPVVFRTLAGDTARGYDPSLLLEICGVMVKAQSAGVLPRQEKRIADNARAVIEKLGSVDVVEFVDRVTGYQQALARDELCTMLEGIISPKLIRWTNRFPSVFFRRVYELENWEYKPGSAKPISWIGELINRYVFEQLPSDVLNELRQDRSAIDDEYRPPQDAECLIPDTGNRTLDCQITALATILCTSKDKGELEKNLRRAFPRVTPLHLLAKPKPPRTYRKRPSRLVDLATPFTDSHQR